MILLSGILNLLFAKNKKYDGQCGGKMKEITLVLVYCQLLIDSGLELLSCFFTLSFCPLFNFIICFYLNTQNI